jgi:hypothetical protein
MYVITMNLTIFKKNLQKIYILGKKVGFASRTIIPDTNPTWPKTSESTLLIIMRYEIASGTNLTGS